MSRIRVLLVDDHPMFREGVRFALPTSRRHRGRRGGGRQSRCDRGRRRHRAGCRPHGPRDAWGRWPRSHRDDRPEPPKHSRRRAHHCQSTMPPSSLRSAPEHGDTSPRVPPARKSAVRAVAAGHILIGAPVAARTLEVLAEPGPTLSRTPRGDPRIRAGPFRSGRRVALRALASTRAVAQAPRLFSSLTGSSDD